MDWLGDDVLTLDQERAIYATPQVGNGFSPCPNCDEYGLAVANDMTVFCRKCGWTEGDSVAPVRERRREAA